MTQECKNWILKHYNSQKGQAYPCSNQSVNKIIFCKEIDEHIYNFLIGKNFIPTKIMKNQLEGFICPEKWFVVKIHDGQQGRRAYKAKIDERISDDVVQQIIMPMMDLYCCEVETF